MLPHDKCKEIRAAASYEKSQRASPDLTVKPLKDLQSRNESR